MPPSPAILTSPWDPASIGAAALLLIGLLYFRAQGRNGAALAAKTLCSILFIVAALVRPHPNQAYFLWILAGLVLSLAGDVFLGLRAKGAFMAGLVGFLLAHVAYVGAFSRLASPAAWATPWAGVVVAISAGVFLWLRPRLGRMTLPVAAYVVVIGVMLIGAVGAATAAASRTAAAITASGAALFYLSDLFVARERFVRSSTFNARVGLPLYYAGQFLLAFSTGLAG